MHMPGGALPLLLTLSAVTAALPSGNEEKGIAMVKRSPHAVIDVGSSHVIHAKRHTGHKKSKCDKEKPKNEHQQHQQPEQQHQQPEQQHQQPEQQRQQAEQQRQQSEQQRQQAEQQHQQPEQKQPEQKQPEQKQPEQKQPEQKQPEQKQPEQKQPEQKQPEQKQPEQKQPEEKQPEEKRPEEKQPEEKQPEEKQPEEKKPEEKKPEEKKPEEKRPEEKRPEEKQPEEKKPEEKKPEEKPSAGKTSSPGCPPNLKNVCFNGVQNAGTAERFTDWGATSWLTPMGITEAPIKGDQLPMCAYARDIDTTIEMISKPDAPEWFLTFNEPEYSYKGMTPTMNPAEAAQAFQKLKDAIDGLKAKGQLKTKFIAPSPADMMSDWLDEFFDSCKCKDYFHAYNVHIYTPDLEEATSKLEEYHKIHGDKPIWVTEIAPGQAEPACSVSLDQAAEYMRGLFHWGKMNNDWVERIFWNSGNQIPDDVNVCNSYLLDKMGGESQLLNDFKNIDCS